MAINQARLAISSLNEPCSLIQPNLSEVIAKETATKIEKLNASIADDLRTVPERVVNEDVTVALEHVESRVCDWSETVVLTLNRADHGPMMLPRPFSVEEKNRIVAAALDLVEVVAANAVLQASLSSALFSLRQIII